MPGLKCPVCNFVWQDRKQFEEVWELKEHDNIKDCVIYLGKVNKELEECINIIEERFRYEKVMRRKILD